MEGVEAVTYIKIEGKRDKFFIGNNGQIFTVTNYKTKPNKVYLRKQHINSSGYLTCTILANGKKESLVHRLVWTAFNGPVSTRLHIDHLDRNKLNNKLVNLRKCTIRQNFANRSGEKLQEGHPAAKVTNKQAVQICEMYFNGKSMEEIGRLFGIQRKAVGSIIRGWTYAKATEEVREKTGVKSRGRHGKSKYNKSEIRKMVEDGFTREQISRKFGMHVNAIWSILKN